MVDIKALYELQLIDTEISGLESALADVRARLADESEVKRAGERLRRMAAQFKEVSGERRGVQASVDQLTEKIDGVETKLYGGTVTNPRELGAYEVERGMVQRQRSGAEDKLLELMVKLEELQENRDKARTILDTLESERAKNVKAWIVDEGRLSQSSKLRAAVEAG